MIRKTMRLAGWLVLLVMLADDAISAERPNIIFIFADDQTVDTLGCYGHPFVQTPEIDALARRGVRFENAFVSQSICWVSRTSILTGLTGRSYGTPASPDVTRAEVAETLYTDLLRAGGYRTGQFGKWHAKMPAGYRPADHFDEYEAIFRTPFYKPQADGSLRHETDLIFDRGISFIENNSAEQPFALNLWLNSCHAEDGDRRPGLHFAWPQSAGELYEEMEMPAPRLSDESIFAALPSFLQTTINRERYFWRWNSDEKYQTNMRAYLRMVSGIDNAIGRLQAALRKAGIAENTIIVYSADNGYHMANRGLAGKWSHFEESLRVPLIIADPRVEASQRGKVVDALALNLDLPATFLDWAGVPVPEQYQGRSLQPIVDGEEPRSWRTETFHEHFAVRNRIPAWEGVRTKRYKYARYFDHENYEFLYDLQSDPDELVNLAGEPAYAETLNALRGRTTAIVDELGGPLEPLQGKFQASTVPYPEAAATVTQRPGADGFVRLFNGRNLSGWQGDRALWSVEDGVLTGETDGSLSANQFITWKGSTVRNFDLRMEVKISSGGNSGIQYRGVSRPEIGLDIVSGYQCDIVANNPNYNGMLYEERGRRILARSGKRVIVAGDGQPWIVGQLAGAAAGNEAAEFDTESWHSYRVSVVGNHHQHWVDGVQTADLIDLDESGRKLDGVLGMQVHVGPAMKVQFKDIKIKHLADDLPLRTAAETEIPVGAIGVKPQGRLPADWQPPVYGDGGE